MNACVSVSGCFYNFYLDGSSLVVVVVVIVVVVMNVSVLAPWLVNHSLFLRFPL